MSAEEIVTVTRALKLNLSLSGIDNRINIGKDVVRALGIPKFVCIKVNEDLSSIAVLPSEEKEYMSVKVPDKLLIEKKAKLRITSKSYVYQLLTTNGLDPSSTFVFHGVLSSNSNAVVFNLTQKVVDFDHLRQEEI